MNDLDTAKLYEKLKCKRNVILTRIRRNGPRGRLHLVRRLHMNNSRVCAMVRQMLDDKLILEELTGKSRRGSRPVPLRVSPGYGHLVGFDIEVKCMRLVAVDFAGNPVWKHRAKLSPSNSRDALLARLLGFIEKGIEKVRSEFRNVLGVGLAAPGVVDVRTGTLLHYDLVEQARNLPLRDLVSTRTGLPVSLDENIRCCTLAEWMRRGGAARVEFRMPGGH